MHLAQSVATPNNHKQACLLVNIEKAHNNQLYV